MIGRLRAYLELARVSNAPTVASSAVAGACLSTIQAPQLLRAWPVAAAALACVLFYVAGMVLNDLLDREIDARERPQRPLPSGRVSPLAAATLACVLIGAGLSALASLGLPAVATGLVLVACIVAYDVVHAMTAWSVLLMGACRGLVYVTAAATVGGDMASPAVIGPAALIAIYVAGFSVAARREAETDGGGPDRRCVGCGHPCDAGAERCPECGRENPRPRTRIRLRFHPAYMLPAVLAAAVLFLPAGGSNWLLGQRPLTGLDVAMGVSALVIVLVMTAWLATAARRADATPPRIGAAVTMWIAAVSLFDAYLLLLARAPLHALVALCCFVVTRLAQRRVAGT